MTPKTVDAVLASHGIKLQAAEQGRCPDGWAPLIASALANLSKPLPIFVQVKEKLGVLRIYTAGATEMQRQVLMAAEMQSQTTCDVCGASSARLVWCGTVARTSCAKHARVKT